MREQWDRISVEGLRELTEGGLALYPGETTVPDDPEEFQAIQVEDGEWIAQYYFGIPYYVFRERGQI